MPNYDLKKIREKCGFTQTQVAEFLNVDQSYIARTESGERNISINNLQKLSCLYGIEYSKLINGEEIKIINMAYRANDLSGEDLETIMKINKIVLNLRFMEEINKR